MPTRFNEQCAKTYARVLITPNPSASPRELIRCVFYDVTGLPPTWQEMNDWLPQIARPGRDSVDDDAGAESRIATGFYCLGVWDDEPDDKRQPEFDDLDSHPLTARVLVNRVWHYHFGKGIVQSTADFGRMGTPPTHPELLDWLAVEFIRSGWSIKHLHRLILQSETFQRSSRVPDVDNPDRLVLDKDPANDLLWRQNLKRLEAESIRDSMLAVSGQLNSTIGGREMFPKLSGEVLAGQSSPGLDWEPSSDEQQRRRSLYAMVKRSVRDPLLDAFDYSNTISPLSERPTTTVAPQSLLLLNSRFTSECGSALAESILTATSDPEEQIEILYRSTLQRDATPDELRILKDLLKQMAIAALLHDLEQRGLLEETLIVWGGEFGRQPVSQGDKGGRDHNPKGFTY